LRREQGARVQEDIMIKLLNIDCMEYMATLPDKAFDLAVVDPPYGLKWSGTGFKKKNIQERNLSVIKEWESKSPTEIYFNELSRVSCAQIIWGGNYFGDYLGKCKAPIIWDKQTGSNTFADGEYAWSSFKTGTLRIFRHQWCGAFKDSERGCVNIHPTQKPVALYDWILRNYAKPGQRILDTHLGSGSSAIAAHYFGCDFVGCEIDVDYFNAAKERFDRETRQVAMF
jgi:site-specific DNA-methyltransferase (adenine-specific)